MKTKFQPNRGVTLIEVLVSLLILAVGVLGLVSTVVYSKSLQHRAVEINEATKIGQTVLESFRKLPYIVLKETIAPGTYTIRNVGNTVTDPSLKAYDIMHPGLLYQLQTKLYERRLYDSVKVEHATDAVRVSVQIWRNGDTETPLVSLVTYIVKNGINFR